MWTVGSMPTLAMKPLCAAAAMRPSSVVARAIAVAACRAWAACAPESMEVNVGAAGIGPAATGACPGTGVAGTWAGSSTDCTGCAGADWAPASNGTGAAS